MGSSVIDPKAMELWATGFNAWGHIYVVNCPEVRDWEDLPKFTRIISDDKIKVKALYMTSTIVETSDGVRFGGDMDSFENTYGSLGHEISIFEPMAITSTDMVAVKMPNGIKQFHPEDSDAFGIHGLELESYHIEKRESQLFDHFDGPVVDVVANATTFTALTSVGTVYTWGDGRIIDRLGRGVTFDSPADTPCVVEDLKSLLDKITRISSGGSLTAALTSNHDIYIWGGGKVPGHPIQLWSSTPSPLDLNDQEFLDVAVGNNHVILLTTEHKVFVIGGNGSGQLGLEDKDDQQDWTEITLPLNEDQHVTRVYAGYNYSFVLVENTEKATSSSDEQGMGDVEGKKVEEAKEQTKEEKEVKKEETAEKEETDETEEKEEAVEKDEAVEKEEIAEKEEIKDKEETTEKEEITEKEEAAHVTLLTLKDTEEQEETEETEVKEEQEKTEETEVKEEQEETEETEEKEEQEETEEKEEKEETGEEDEEGETEEKEAT